MLVTGATGSLGAHIVAYLAQCSSVDKVVCLNRLSTTEATLRQQKSLEMRGILLDPACLSKLDVMETDTSKPTLGLSPEKYHDLIRKVTHIVHSAWPISLTRPTRTFEPQFKIVRNLIDLASEIARQRPFKRRVPEQPVTLESTPLTGYAEAKLATEHILAETLNRYPDSFRVMAVRIAQISGSRSNGYWNPTEYIPFLMKSSQALKSLPDLDGTLPWSPVDDVAATLGQLLMADDATRLIYHIDNPSRQSWRDVIANIARGLDIEANGIVSYEQWVDQVRRFGESPTKNPALQLNENYFVPMSCGGLILDTTWSSRHSETLRTQGPIDDSLMMEYIIWWKQSGFSNS